MTDQTASLRRLPELPLELFEQAGKLTYSDTAPVLTVKADTVSAPEPLAASTPHQDNRSSFAIKRYSAVTTFPQVICYPRPEGEFTAFLTLENNDCGLKDGERDFEAIGRSRRYYKLSHFNGADLPTPYGCVVHYGPWFASVIEVESCSSFSSSRWTLYIPQPNLVLNWFGTWNDIPSYPNLWVGDELVLTKTEWQCCAGFRWCPTTGSCIPSQLNCPDLVPA